MSDEHELTSKSKRVSPAPSLPLCVLLLLVLVLLTPLLVLFAAGSDEETLATLPAFLSGCWLIAVLAIGWFYSRDRNSALDEDG